MRRRKKMIRRGGFLTSFDSEGFAKAVEDSGFLRTDLSRRAGLFPFAVHRYAAGKVKPSRAALEAVCSVIGRNPVEFSDDFSMPQTRPVAAKIPKPEKPKDRANHVRTSGVTFIRQVRLELGNELSACGNLEEGARLGKAIALLNLTIGVLNEEKKGT